MSRRIGIIGMGASGQAAAKLAVHNNARVQTFDSRINAPTIKGTKAFHGIDPLDLLVKQDLIVISPGVPLEHPMLLNARENNIPILSELSFAAQYIDIPMLAITGTNGKSSTTWFTAQFLKQAGRNPFFGGNFGTALSELALNPLDASGIPFDIAVVEVSSYQLESPGDFSPHAAVALNLTPDHLARHKTMDSYAEHKRRIFAKQTDSDWAIAPHNDPRLHTQSTAQKLWIDSFPGASVLEKNIILKGTPCDGDFSLEGATLYGTHNQQNLMASLLLCSTIGINPSTLDVRQLQPLAHRLERIPSTDGILWINDSKATNVEATLAGIAGAPAPQILLLGGSGKSGADYTQLLPLIKERVRSVICFGASRGIIQTQIPQSSSCPSLDDAIEQARKIARPNDTILLSPACASFDSFSNFAARGTYFAQLVNGLQS
jgi:UDP-N-acetylmuramoylalanine--D-glutamate ligase